jgi:hypothetical protein
MTAVLVGVLAFAAAGDAPAQQPGGEIQQVKNFLTGKVQAYYRVGGILYGTHHLFDLEYKADGRYTLEANTGRTTIMGNFQPGGWRDAGRWEVVRVGQQVGVRHVSDNGFQEFFPLKALPGGGVELLPDGLPGGTERYWIIQGWKYKLGNDGTSVSLDPR